jgi:hypothetical protein
MKILDVPQSGSVAGTTSSRNRFGQYRRTRAIPVNPNTAYQQAIRSDFSTHSAAWRSLDTAEQEAWQTYAAAHPYTDGLGQQIILTGTQMYIAVNTRLTAAGFAAVTAPPADPGPDPVLTATLAGTGPATLTLTFTPTPVPANTNFLVYASAPLSAGRSYPGQFKLIAVIVAAATSPDGLGPEYVARWGNFIAGQRIYVRLIAVRNDGASSQPLTLDDIAS